MQYFGKYHLGFDKEFLEESYLYFPSANGEKLSVEEFEALIKSKKLKKDNIAGTIFMYNPFVYPLNYHSQKFLSQQGYQFDGQFDELQVEKEMTVFKACIKGYEGKLVQVRYLFNLNSHKIDTSERLMAFNQDTEIMYSQQYTIFDRINYTDPATMTIQGKFVFFAWGHKINKKEFVYIHGYAQAIYEKCVQTQKKIAYSYRKSMKQPYSVEHLQFMSPSQTGRFSSNMGLSIKKAFSTVPPLPAAFDDITALN
jgi:hypothetical protein